MRAFCFCSRWAMSLMPTANLTICNTIYFAQQSQLSNSIANQNNIKIGQRVLYTGYPNLTGPLTIYGTVAGFSVDNSIILQSYAWGGASGSAVLDYKGRLIGVVNGIEVVMSMTGLPSENENVILIKRFEEDLLRHVDFLLDN